GGEHFGGAYERRDVDVVTTGVHDRDVGAGVILGADFAGVGQPGFFLDGEGVHVGAHEEGWASAVLHNGDNPVALPIGIGVFDDVFGDVVGEGTKAFGEERRGFVFVVRQFGGGVEGFVGGNEGREFLIDEGGKFALWRSS